MSNEEESTCQFLLLPECVLRVLFSYLDSTTLYQLTKTCRYFQYFIMDPGFWRYIDARKNPNTNDKVQYCSDRIHERTTHIFLKAKDKTSGIVPYDFFKTVNAFQNIKVLALENQRFHGSRLTLKDFPPCLEELSLKSTHIKSSTYFFQHSGQNMQKLRVLILDQCQWVTCSFLMSVAKYENLEIISAVKCLRLHLNMIPYLNVARYGCKKLKVFDCRFTSIGHELLRSFYPKESLQSLYFQSLRSAEVDYNEYIFNQSYMRTESTNRPREGDNSICDESLFEYINSSACEMVDKISDSVLYKDPYPDCTCSKNDESQLPPLVKFDEYYVCNPPRRRSIKFVCQRHIQDVERLSDHFRDFFLTNQHQFYADVKASEVESDGGSSDSESDDNCGTCCMYGMGRSMILLTPGNNPGTIQEEVLTLNPEEHEQCGRVVSIFISKPWGEGFNNSPNNANPVPSTSRGVQENSTNENLENSRRESKRRRSVDDANEQNSENESKRSKRKEELEQLSDEAKAAEANELIKSAERMEKSMDEFVQSSLEMCNRNRDVRQEKPTTSKVQDEEMETDNKINQLQETQNKEGTSTKGNEDSVASTSSIHRRRGFEIGESSRAFNNNEMESEVRRNQIREAQAEGDRANNDLPNNDRPEISLNPNYYVREIGDESARAQLTFNSPRTAVITIRNRERSRYVNPLFVQIENKHIKKKSRLRRLSLRGFRKITNVALDYIKNLKLDLLDLTYTSVTKEGIENFLAYNPNCRVVHPLYCICKPLNPF